VSQSIEPDVEPSRLRLLWSAVTDVEWARVRPVSGLQRAAVIALAMAVTVPEADHEPDTSETVAVMREAADFAARAAHHVCGSAPRLAG
jgi:hypothetical protein